MKAFLYTFYLKTKLDIKSADILITNYLVPLLFFGVMGAVFTSIMPEYKSTLIASMIIFSVTMGALIGIPGSIMEYFQNDLRKSFKSAGIPLDVLAASSFISGFLNLSVVSSIIYVVSPIAFDATIPENTGLFLVGFAAFLTATLLFGILLGLYAKSTSQLTMFSQVVFLPSMMLSGIMFPVEMLPGPLQYVGHLFPATHGMKILSTGNLETGNLVILSAFIVVLAALIKLRINRLKKEDAR